jgi:hypothetical protein
VAEFGPELVSEIVKHMVRFGTGCQNVAGRVAIYWVLLLHAFNHPLATGTLAAHQKQAGG